MNPYDWLDDFKKKDKVNLVEINMDNRNELPIEIVQELTNDNPQMQRKIEKAKRYSLELNRFSILEDKIVINSEHGIRTIKKEKDKYVCDCEFYKENHTCSHIMAIINANISF